MRLEIKKLKNSSYTDKLNHIVVVIFRRTVRRGKLRGGAGILPSVMQQWLRNNDHEGHGQSLFPRGSISGCRSLWPA